jgi:glycosyltransferase involved in cell wall biosynthesis
MRRSVLIVVQNLPLPQDRRVWLECQALRDDGWEVAAITPKAPGAAVYELLEGVHLYRYKAPKTATDTRSYLWEFLYCWVRTAWLSARVWRRHRFTVMQACNPPDTYWLLALLLRPLGVRFVFDQHDLCPEVYRVRGKASNVWLLKGLYWLERFTYRSADKVISTNESYRDIASRRGRVPEHKLTIVRSGPDASVLKRGGEVSELRRGRAHLAVYLGVMGPQDGVENLVEAIHHYVGTLGRTDTTFALLGSGDCWDAVHASVTRLGLGEFVSMPGWADDEMIAQHLSTADVGLCPDPPNSFNDASTMNKTMEYMAYEVPLVAFDLKETRFSAQDSGVYVQGGRPEDFAQAFAGLIDDPERRADMGARARRRVEEHLDWMHQRPRYLSVYRSLSE